MIKLTHQIRCVFREQCKEETVQETLGDIKRCFNHDNDPYTNQQLIRCKNLFRGVIVKEWHYQVRNALILNCIIK